MVQRVGPEMRERQEDRVVDHLAIANGVQLEQTPVHVFPSLRTIKAENNMKKKTERKDRTIDFSQ